MASLSPPVTVQIEHGRDGGPRVGSAPLADGARTTEQGEGEAGIGDEPVDDAATDSSPNPRRLLDTGRHADHCRDLRQFLALDGDHPIMDDAVNRSTFRVEERNKKILSFNCYSWSFCF